MSDTKSLDETSADIEKTTRKPQILAVDDTTVMLKTISLALSDDYDVFTLSDPMMVEKYLRQMKPDLILLDYKMPYLNGFELVPVIRKIEKHKDTPIIFLTSMGTNDHILTAASLGVSDFIVKPFKTEILREKIAKHIAPKK